MSNFEVSEPILNSPFEEPQDLLSCAVRQSLEDFGQMPFLTSEVMGDA